VNDNLRIASAAVRQLMGNKEDPELVLLTLPGSSGSRVVIFRNVRTGRLLSVKCAREPRVSLAKEAENHRYLQGYLGDRLPSILWYGSVEDRDVLISECAGLTTLHTRIMGGDVPMEQSLDVWRDYLDRLQAMWISSRRDGFRMDECPRVFPARLERIRNGVRTSVLENVSLSERWDCPIEVNGRDYPSLAECFDCISQLGIPGCSVTCHGDPQPSNIVVGADGWKCIDWEWSGPGHDWRMLASHLYGWWSTRCLVLRTNPSVKTWGGKLHIGFDARLPSHLRPFQIEAETAIRHAASGLGETNATQDINRYLAALYLGETRFLSIWGRQAFAAPMIAQAAMTVSRILDGCQNVSSPIYFGKENENV
jgi:aminoglycoside phosphotransferase